MAEMVGGGGGGGKKGGSKSKKKSTKVDMTAMVDVAFLLLTFFVLTAAMSNSSVMDLALPPKVKDPMDEDKIKQDVDEAKVVTFILGEKDTVLWYQGVTDIKVEATTYGPEGIRKVVTDHIKRFGPLCKDVNNASGCWDPIFVIKPRWNCTYGNVVDILDEMAITKAPKYAIDKFDKDDSLAIFVNAGK